MQLYVTEHAYLNAHVCH